MPVFQALISSLGGFLEPAYLGLRPRLVCRAVGACTIAGAPFHPRQDPSRKIPTVSL